MADSSRLGNHLESVINVDPNITSGKYLHLHHFIAQSNNSSTDSVSDASVRSVFTKTALELTIILSAYSFLVIFSICINIIVCYILIRNRRLLTVTNCFIMNLSISDIVLTLLNIPFNVIRNTTEKWMFGQFMCQSTNFILNVSVYASTFTMAAIALERYRVIMCPLRPRLSYCMAVVILVTIWLLAIGMSSPFAIFAEVSNVHFMLYDTPRCRLKYPEPQQVYERYIILVTFICQYVLPLILTVITYAHIVYKLWSREVIGHSIENQQVSHLKSRKRSIRMLVIVVALFSISWMPLNMYHILLNFHPDRTAFVPNSNVYLGFHWLAMSSVCYNPLVYCWTKGAFRAELRKSIMCLMRNRPCHKDPSKLKRDKSQRAQMHEYSTLSVKNGGCKKSLSNVSKSAKQNSSKSRADIQEVDELYNVARERKSDSYCSSSGSKKVSNTDNPSNCSRAEVSWSECSQYNQWV